MEPDDGLEEEGPFSAWLPPDDRLWRHPSEVPVNLEPDNSREGTRMASGGRLPASTFVGTLAPGPVTRIWVVAVVAGIIGAAAASGVGMVSGAFGPENTTVVHSVMPTAPVETLAAATASNVDWTAVDDAIAPSVVEINVSTASGPASGSGVLFQPGNGETYVITDSSLVSGANSIQTILLSGASYGARLVGSDPISGLALIAVPTSTQNFPELGTAAGLQLANAVLAVGARTTDGGSVFPGSIRAEDLQVDATSGTVLQNLIGVNGPPSIPSSAAGGPLVDQQGTVVGITVSVDPTDINDKGLLLAVPVDVAMHVAQQLLAGTSVTHPWLGVTDSVDLPGGGVSVGQVSPGSPASGLGLASNDIITSLNGQPVTSCGALTQLLFSQTQPGRRVMISYVHNGKPLQASLTVRNQPDGD